MALSHRKLSKDPIFDATSCQPFCDIIFNPKGLCPGHCFSSCASTCKIPMPDGPDVILLPPPPPPPQVYIQQHHQLEISTRSLIFIITLVTFFAVFFCFVSYKCFKAYRYRSRSTRLTRELRVLTENTHQDFLDEDHGFVLDHPIWYIRTIGLQPSVISAITICKYKKGEGLVEGTECSVCLSEFQDDETLRLLPKCNHAFHIPCIDTWLRSHTNCPLCRAGIVSNIAVLPAPEQRSDDPSIVEDARVGGVVNDNEDRREIVRGDSELRRCAREEGEPRGESEHKSNEMEKQQLESLDQVEVSEVYQPKRRSHSVDFSSANSDEIGFVSKGVIDVDQGRLVGSSSLQNESFLMSRSFSYSDKVLLSRQNNSQSRS